VFCTNCVVTRLLNWLVCVLHIWIQVMVQLMYLGLEGSYQASTKSYMLLWTAVIALYCHTVPIFICCLDTENDSFCNLQHRIYKLRIVYITMCTKFRYCFMMTGCQSVEMSRSYVSTRCIQVSSFEFRPQSLSPPQCCPTTNILIDIVPSDRL
jgi:hypothetical protein